MNLREGIRRIFLIAAVVLSGTVAVKNLDMPPSEYKTTRFWADAVKSSMEFDAEQAGAKYIRLPVDDKTYLSTACGLPIGKETAKTCALYSSDSKEFPWNRLMGWGAWLLSVAGTFLFVLLLWWVLDWVLRGFLRPSALEQK